MRILVVADTDRDDISPTQSSYRASCEIDRMRGFALDPVSIERVSREANGVSDRPPWQTYEKGMTSLSLAVERNAMSLTPGRSVVRIPSAAGCWPGRHELSITEEPQVVRAPGRA